MHEVEGDFPFEEVPGWYGAFTRAQAAGAYATGSTIVKAVSEAGDGTPDGTRGLVLGSFSHPEIRGGEILYFVEWENRPRCAVAVIAHKVKPAPAMGA